MTNDNLNVEEHENDIKILEEKLEMYWEKWSWIAPSINIIIKVLTLVFILGCIASLTLFAASFFTDKIAHPWYSYLILFICFLYLSNFLGVFTVILKIPEVLISRVESLGYFSSSMSSFKIVIAWFGISYFGNVLFDNQFMTVIEAIILILIVLLDIMGGSFYKHVTSEIHRLLIRRAVSEAEESIEKDKLKDRDRDIEL